MKEKGAQDRSFQPSMKAASLADRAGRSRSSHSQTVSTDQPSRASSTWCAASRLRLRSIFGSQ
jgi:hypothetical protein